MKKLSEIGSEIKARRWMKMIKQKDLAKKLGCRPSHLCEIENGKKLPSIEMLWEIEKYLGKTWIREDLK